MTTPNGDVPSPRNYHGACVHESNFYVFGGVGNDGIIQDLDHVHILNLQNFVWYVPSPLFLVDTDQ